MKRTLACFALAAAPALANAQPIDDALILNARVLDVETGNMREAQVVAVENGEIVYIGNRRSAPSIDGAPVFNLDGATLLPGLSDARGGC